MSELPTAGKIKGQTGKLYPGADQGMPRGCQRAPLQERNTRSPTQINEVIPRKCHDHLSPFDYRDLHHCPDADDDRPRWVLIFSPLFGIPGYLRSSLQFKTLSGTNCLFDHRPMRRFLHCPNPCRMLCTV